MDGGGDGGRAGVPPPDAAAAKRRYWGALVDGMAPSPSLLTAESVVALCTAGADPSTSLHHSTDTSYGDITSAGAMGAGAMGGGGTGAVVCMDMDTVMALLGDVASLVFIDVDNPGLLFRQYVAVALVAPVPVPAGAAGGGTHRPATHSGTRAASTPGGATLPPFYTPASSIRKAARPRGDGGGGGGGGGGRGGGRGGSGYAYTTSMASSAASTDSFASASSASSPPSYMDAGMDAGMGTGAGTGGHIFLHGIGSDDGDDGDDGGDWSYMHGGASDGLHFAPRTGLPVMHEAALRHVFQRYAVPVADPGPPTGGTLSSQWRSPATATRVVNGGGGAACGCRHAHHRAGAQPGRPRHTHQRVHVPQRQW